MRTIAPITAVLTEGSADAAGATRRLGPIERARLWLSYQRYALLMAAVPSAVVGAVAWRWPSAWWAWGPLALFLPWFYRTALDIWRRFPRKMRATLLADLRIRAGRFEPRMVRRYCGDPCFRVVAVEILTRAGIPSAERRRLIARFAEEEAERGHTLVFARPDGSVQIHVDGKSIRRLPQSGAGAPIQPEEEENRSWPES